MYVCICNAITEKKLRTAVKDPSVRTAKQAYQSLGCAVNCGQCLRAASDVLAEENCADFGMAAE